MFDVKSKKITKLSKFSDDNKEYAKALLLILARLNFTKLVTSRALPKNSHALLRTKFINVFHAVSSLNILQAIIRKQGSSELENAFFKAVCGEENVKWINKQASLRNFLTHYLLDNKQLKRMKPLFTREDAIYVLSGGVSMATIEQRLDIAIENITTHIERFFNLEEESFWLHKVDP
ncbi:hypothetical protein [Psychrobacter sp. FDAARGOS_221]|uniref:hypothetical protein n=1 Tax=Psychrobacter sp. FDAARGOS_221 TaxID=1975705 RepID=UPI000BB5420E|nr:hypothetical protein [Psychrobacter sp. FDAARGOS_221]PNK59804.1 hypothetical protein A6J60_002190 [Psychrobacter sp. FDAARGOS_221]